MINWICARLEHRIRWYGPLGCECHCLCNVGWLNVEPNPTGGVMRDRLAYMWVGFLLGIVVARLHLLDFLWREFNR